MTSATHTRIRLRPVTADDLAQIETWYDEALTVAHAERSLKTRFADAKAARCELLAIEAIGGRGWSPDLPAQKGPIGLIDYRVDDPAKGWLTTVLIAIAAGRRGWGYGSEAVRALEDRGGAQNCLANVHRRNGLGLYFWLRLGYHPAHAEEMFWRAPDENDTIAMIRSSE